LVNLPIGILPIWSMAMAIRRYGKVKNMAMHLFWSFVGPEFTDQAVRESMILDFAKSTSDYSWSD